MRLIRPIPPLLRLALCVVLFLACLLLLLADGLSPAKYAVWITVLAALAAMVWLTVSLKDHRALRLTSCALFLFLLNFAIRRILSNVLLWPSLDGSAHRMAIIQIVSAFAAAIAGLAILPLFKGSGHHDHAPFAAAAENTLDDFYLFDGVPDASGQIVDFRFKYLNPNAERRLNKTRHELKGRILTEVRPFMVTSGLIEHYREVVRTGRPYTVDVFLDDHMIQATWINVQVVKIGNGIAITSRDITESKRLNDHHAFLAHHDQLTGLPNRALLRDRLHQAILRAQRQHHKVGLFMLDVDNFKTINDSLGHATGDLLLAAIARRLLTAVRETDTVARIGGDEFVIVMPDFKTTEDVLHCGRDLVARTSHPILIDDREIAVTLSIGLCIYPDCGLDEDQLLKNADTAMYTVKQRGRNGLHVFPTNL